MKVRELFEDISADLVSEWTKSLSPPEIKIYSIRDNCGPAALDFIDWAKKTHSLKLTRVRGHFLADVCIFDKADFTKDMKTDFLKSGLNFNSTSDREKWINQSSFADEWKLIPHYWAIDDEHKIYDPSGVWQFIETGLSTDLNKRRYKY